MARGGRINLHIRMYTGITIRRQEEDAVPRGRLQLPAPSLKQEGSSKAIELGGLFWVVTVI